MNPNFIPATLITIIFFYFLWKVIYNPMDKPLDEQIYIAQLKQDIENAEKRSILGDKEAQEELEDLKNELSSYEDITLTS